MTGREGHLLVFFKAMGIVTHVSTFRSFLRKLKSSEYEGIVKEKSLKISSGEGDSVFRFSSGWVENLIMFGKLPNDLQLPVGWCWSECGLLQWEKKQGHHTHIHLYI